MASNQPETSLCLRIYAPRPSALTHLYCFAWAGGGASAFQDWARRIADDVELRGVCLAGRESRFSEPPVRRLDPIVDELTPAIARAAWGRFAFFGHSLGALIAFAICRRLRALGHPLPVHLFVSGRTAPHVPLAHPPIHDQSDSEVIEALQRFGGAPPEVLAHPELMELLLPIVRADLAVNETYEHTPEPPLPIPITAFGGVDDEDVPLASLDAWREHTAAEFRRTSYPGGHFFLLDASDRMLAEIADALAAEP